MLVVAAPIPPTPAQAAALHTALHQGAGYVGHAWAALGGEGGRSGGGGGEGGEEGVRGEGHGGGGLVLGFVRRAMAEAAAAAGAVRGTGT